MHVGEQSAEVMAMQHAGSQSSKRIENGKVIEETKRVVGVREITDEGEHYFTAGKNDKFTA